MDQPDLPSPSSGDRAADPAVGATGRAPTARTEDDAARRAAPSRAGGRVRLGVFVAGGLLVALALAFFVGPRASSQPDGLNKVAIDQGFADTEDAHHLADGPTAGYAVEGVDDDGLSTGLAGLIGVTVTFALCGGLVLLLRRSGGGPARSRTATVTSSP